MPYHDHETIKSKHENLEIYKTKIKMKRKNRLGQILKI